MATKQPKPALGYKLISGASTLAMAKAECERLDRLNDVPGQMLMPGAPRRELAIGDCRQARAPERRPWQSSDGRCRNLWVLVSYLQEFDGTPNYVSRHTKGHQDGAEPQWTPSPREAKQFNSRQAARQFLKRLNTYQAECLPQNLARYGFAG